LPIKPQRMLKISSTLINAVWKRLITDYRSVSKVSGRYGIVWQA